MIKLFKNIYFYAVIFIIGLFFLLNIKDAYTNFGLNDERENEIKNYCVELLETPPEERREDENLYSNCELMIKYDVYKLDAYSVYVNILDGLGFDLFMFFVCPLLITISFVFYVCKLFKSKIIKDYLLREDYKTFLKHIFKTAYKSTIIIPIFLIITFLCSWHISGHLSYQPFAQISSLPVKILEGMPINAIAYILNIIFVYSIVVSLALINASKNKNPFLVIIETFIMFIVIEFFNEIVLEPILFKMNVDSGGLLFLNLYNLNGSWNIWTCTLELLIYNVIIGIFVYFSYKNKEKLIQMCEE